MRDLFKKFFKNKEDNKEEKYKNIILPKIKAFQEVISNKDTISFLHYGHLGDIINSLALVKEISKTKKCNFYVQKNKKIPIDVKKKDHPLGEVYLTEEIINKLIPLLKKQNYLNEVKIFNKEIIDVDLNFFRELPYNFNMDSVRWYYHLLGVHTDASKNWISVDSSDKFKNYIIILRSLRRQNKFINYSFLSKYKNVVFIGLKNEYEDLKKSITNLEYYDSKDFLELASIIKNAKIFIGNLSFGYALAEAIKVPRLLESGPNFPLIYPSGSKAYDFYFQLHFEKHVENLYSA